jgi:hypothetical protein
VPEHLEIQQVMRKHPEIRPIDKSLMEPPGMEELE